MRSSSSDSSDAEPSNYFENPRAQALRIWQTNCRASAAVLEARWAALSAANKETHWQNAMDAGYLTVIAALGGATLGGFTSFATSWTTLRAQMKASGNASSKSRRRKLYKSFINTASQVYGDALIHDNPELSGLIELHALVSLMRVNSSTPVIESAVKVVMVITKTYTEPNKTAPELEAMVQNGGVDILRAFSEACRTELESRF